MMLKEYVKFYYTVLTEEQKQVYKSLYNGFKEKKKSIFVEADTRMISSQDISDIAVYVYNDSPLFYYVDIKKHRIEKKLFGYQFHCEYLMSEKEISKTNSFLEKGIDAFKKLYLTPGLAEYDIEKQIHDYLIKTAIYDYDATENLNFNGESFNALGPLLHKKGVCWGFSCAFKLLCDSCGIKCFVILGQVERNGVDEEHAWNVVKINDDCYHVDVTWDLNDKFQTNDNHEYFNLDDKTMQLDHKWDNMFYPKCTAVTLNYYNKSNLCVTKVEDISNLVKTKIESGNKVIVFKFTGELADKENLEKAIQTGANMTSGGFTYSYSISETHKTVYIEIK